MTNTPQPLDERRFRDTIGLFATGVAVVASGLGEEVLAMTVNAVSAVSLDPMLVLFCPGKKTRFGLRIGELSGFTINILRHEQQALSSYFAGSWKDPTPPPFRMVPSRSAPRLEGALACIDCETASVTDVGDHWVVIGRVRELHQGVHPHHPLVFFHGKYRGVDFSESQPAPDITGVHEQPAHIFHDW